MNTCPPFPRSPLLDVVDPLRVCADSNDLRGGVEFSVRIGANSKLRQVIQLDSGSASIKFRTFVSCPLNECVSSSRSLRLGKVIKVLESKSSINCNDSSR